MQVHKSFEFIWPGVSKKKTELQKLGFLRIWLITYAGYIVVSIFPTAILLLYLTFFRNSAVEIVLFLTVYSIAYVLATKYTIGYFRILWWVPLALGIFIGYMMAVPDGGELTVYLTTLPLNFFREALGEPFLTYNISNLGFWMSWGIYTGLFLTLGIITYLFFKKRFEFSWLNLVKYIVLGISAGVFFSVLVMLTGFHIFFTSTIVALAPSIFGALAIYSESSQFWVFKDILGYEPSNIKDEPVNVEIIPLQEPKKAFNILPSLGDDYDSHYIEAFVSRDDTMKTDSSKNYKTEVKPVYSGGIIGKLDDVLIRINLDKNLEIDSLKIYISTFLNENIETVYSIEPIQFSEASIKINDIKWVYCDNIKYFYCRRNSTDELIVKFADNNEYETFRIGENLLVDIYDKKHLIGIRIFE